jgi:uncharacterized protein
MSVAAQPVPNADVAVLRRSLARDGRQVILRETPASTVFLTGERAFKLRKPVHADGPGRRELRMVACHREVELNASLSPGVAIGVRAVVPMSAETYALEPADDPRAIDHVVEMRRFDEASTMRGLLQRGALTSEQAAAAGGRLARFHRTATPDRGGVDYRARVDRNFEALMPLAERLVPVLEQLSWQRFAAAFMLGSAPVMDARAATGNVIDGHGDLRAHHVVFEAGEVLLVGRLDLDAARVVDAADEVAQLLTELDALRGSRDLADALLTGYVSGGGARPPDALLAFFGAYRAQVHAKDTLRRPARRDADAHAARATARRLLALSRRMAWRARGPLLVLVTGPPGTGRATLARALGVASGLPVLTPRTTTELAVCVRRDRAAILDTTAGHCEVRRALAERPAVGTARPLVVACHAPPRRPWERDERRPAIEGVGGDARLVVDTRAPIELQVDAVESWLDALEATDRIT